MGQTLSEPVTVKDSVSVRNSDYQVGSSCMQGWRVNMEDSHTHILSLPDDAGAAYFGVFDGHGGAKTAEYAGKHLHKYIVNREEYREGKISTAIQNAFLELDDVMRTDDDLKCEQSGSTAVTVIIKDNKLYCANIGDSRAIACVNNKLVKLSWDHKPSNTTEYDRIVNAGGWVDCNRVNGNLALSRAFGDYIFKKNTFRDPEKQIVIAFPDIVEKTVTPEWDFLVLACDGIWDVMSNNAVLNYVVENIAEGHAPEIICENLMMKCLAPDCFMAGLGCDNMTVVIVVFLHGRTYKEVVDKCKRYVEENKAAENESSEIINSVLNSNSVVSNQNHNEDGNKEQKEDDNDDSKTTTTVTSCTEENDPSNVEVNENQEEGKDEEK